MSTSTASDFSLIADGLSAANVAEYTGVDEAEAQRWLDGEEPPPEHVHMLEVATGLDADQWASLAAEARKELADAEERVAAGTGSGAVPEPEPIALPPGGGDAGGAAPAPDGGSEVADVANKPAEAPPVPPPPAVKPPTAGSSGVGAARVAARAGVLLASDPDTVAAIGVITGQDGLDAVDAAETVAGFGPGVADALRRVAGFLDRLGS